MHTSPKTSDFMSAEHLLAAIVDSSEDAIVSKSLDGIITSWNRAAERLFGYKVEEMVGQSILRIIPAEGHGEESAIIRRLKNGERIEHFETERLSKSARRIQVSLTISPVRSTSGEIVGASKIARDISEKQRAEQALREATEAIALQNRIKDEFLATLSHELRTPLQSILGWVQLLRSEEIENPEVVKGLEVIARNAGAQQRIIEDMLDMNRILAGKIRLDVVPIFLPAIIQAAIETVRPALEARQMHLTTELDQAAGTGIIKGDAQRLQQIFWNLLNNAVKFTPPKGQITVRLKLRDDCAEVVVEDSGMGIEQEFLPHVFELFRQADASATRAHGGLGLGLAIVKNLVELHGGEIQASSPGLGQGSQFLVKLPILATQTPAGTSPAPGTPLPASVSQGKWGGGWRGWPSLSSMMTKTLCMCWRKP
jgi:PAS domain S-box-containing protein